MLKFDNGTDLTSLNMPAVDVAAMYGDSYTEPEDCPALTSEEAAKVLEETMAKK